MADRRDLQEEINRINELYQEYDRQLSKAGASIEQRQQLRDTMNAKKKELLASMGDDLQKINLKGTANVGQGTITRGAVDTIGEGMDISKVPRIGKKAAILKSVGKKLLGAVPLVGGIAQAIDSGDASAAVPGLDEAEDVGMSAADENQMLSEIQARKDYANSPARMAKLKMLMGKK